MRHNAETDNKNALSVNLALLLAALLLLNGCSSNDSCWKRMNLGKQTDNLLAIWGSSTSNIYAVGHIRTILHYDGNEWSSLEVIPAAPLTDIWGLAPEYVFAAGSTPMHSDGTAWTNIDGIPAGDYYSVWGSSEDDVFLVGNEGLIAHFDGEQWSEMNSNTTERLTNIWGSSSTDIYATGTNNTSIHYDGLEWQAIDPPDSSSIGGIWGSSPDNIYFIHSEGILHYDGTDWREEDIGNIASGSLLAIHGRSSTDIYAVGNSGLALHYDGNNWSDISFKLHGSLKDVWIGSEGPAFAAGCRWKDVTCVAVVYQYTCQK